MSFKKEELKEIIKSTLFVAGDGLEIDYIAEKLEVKISDVKKAIEELKLENTDNSGIQIIEYKNKIQLSSNPKYADYISIILNPIREKALTKAALETVAIIAYKQPITRLEIEDIRRVNCDYAINVLEEHKMIEVVGRKDAVGKPLLYGTTDEFLKRFGLTDLNALPNYDELMERIAIIRQEETQKSDSLYRDYKLQDLSAEQNNNSLETQEKQSNEHENSEEFENNSNIDNNVNNEIEQQNSEKQDNNLTSNIIDENNLNLVKESLENLKNIANLNKKQEEQENRKDNALA